MTWWNLKSKPNDEIVDPVGSKIGTYSVPADALVNRKSQPAQEPLPNPEPDLSTKPPDKVGFCFGYVCPKKHVFETFEAICVDGYKQRRVCQTCGGVGKPAVVKRTAEAQWGNCAEPSYYSYACPRAEWRWYNSYINGFGRSVELGQILWTKYEFVHYLESPKRKKK